MLEIGTKGKQETIVDETNIATKVGSGKVRVFATPMMIALMEETASLSVENLLDKGFSTVGTLVNINHISATPVGMKVWAESELIEIDRKRLVFKVSAYDEKGMIGSGLHERFIINIDKFQTKTNEK